MLMLQIIRTETMKILIALALVLATSACVLVTEPPYGAKSGGAGQDVVLCHKGKKTMTLPREAAAAHIDHGDRYGAC